MSARQTLTGISALLLGAGAVNLGFGLQASLLGLRAGMEGFPTWVTGIVMASYYAGFILGSLHCPGLVDRVGHIRVFAALASIASAAALCHAILVHPVAWVLFRGATGYCFAGLCLVGESWLNERANNLNRGTVLAVYMIVILAATAGGQLLLNLASPGGMELFILVSVVVSLALVPVALTRQPMPAPMTTTRMSLKDLFTTVPVAVVGCLAAGLILGAFWSLGAVFAQQIGLSTLEVSIFMTLLVSGGLLSQWPVGRLSDRLDRRLVIGGLCVGIVGVAALVPGVAMAAGGPVLLALVALFGALALPLYALSVAHANDHLEAGRFVSAASALLLVYGVGATLGPVSASLTMAHAGPKGLFLFAATVATITVAFVAYRLTRRALVSREELSDFVAVPRTSSAALGLDPRADDIGQESEVTMTPSA